ncbi:MAG: GNAT family N-acetyltransferase [Lapillicoccus sp.]
MRTTGSYELTFLEGERQARQFLTVAGDWMAADPVVSSVVATQAVRVAGSAGTGPAPPFPFWWLVVRSDDGRVVGAAMRSAPFVPHPPYVLPMPPQAAREVGLALADRGEAVSSIVGPLPTVEVTADAYAGVLGLSCNTALPTRMYELREVREPPSPGGQLRLAREEDLDLVDAWMDLFHPDAEEQSGRPRIPAEKGGQSPPEQRARIARGETWLWEDRHGVPVCLGSANPSALGVRRVGPVYTPPAHRGRGYAKACVAAVSRIVLEEGDRVCLVTDLGNPASNATYTAIGYEPVVDLATVGMTR